MFNQTGIKRTKAAAPVQILFNVQNQMAVSILVDKNITPITVDGRKIIKAGTPLAGDLTDRSKVFVSPVAAAEGATAKPAVGVLLHDVDVTDGDANGSLLIWGFVNLNRLDDATRNLALEAKDALDGKVWLLKDN